MDKLFKHPAVITGVITIITVFLGFQLPRAELDNNNIRFLPDNNEAKVISEYIDETFGGQVMILIGLERPYRTVFEKDFLERIREFSLAAENIDMVKSVNSIMSTQYITGDGDSIIVSDLVPEDFSGTQDEIDELRRRIASWDLFRGSLVSDDLSAAQILVTLDVLTENMGSPEVSRSYFEIREAAEEVFSDTAQVYFTGMPVMNATINRSIIADNLLLIPLVVIVVLALLFFSFRRFTFVILPLLTVIIAVVWTIGMAALFGIKLSVLTTILPVILVAVGSAYGIHIVTHYAQDTRNKILSIEEHRALVIELVRKLIKPVALAALTTLAGFVSFCFTPIVPMMEFGYCAGFGVLAAFLIAVLFIPSMFLLRGPRVLNDTPKEQTGNDQFSNAISRVFLGIAQKKRLVLSCAALAAVISVYGLSKVIIDNAVIEFFQKETDMSRSDRFIRDYFGGSKDINLVVETDTPEEILHPGVLRAVDELSGYLTENVPIVGKVIGFTDIIKRINQVFNVGESPDGLRPAVSYNETGNFGFGGFDDFGFGDFGFGSFDDIDFDSDFVPEGPPTAYSWPSHDLAQYTAADLLRFFDSASGKSHTLSGSDLVREVKRLTNYDGMAYYEIPVNPKRYGKETEEDLGRLIANYLVLLAGDDEMLYSNDPYEPTVIRTMIQLRATGSQEILDVIDIINEYVNVNFPKNVRVMIGGGAIQEIAITELIFNSQIISIFISVFMVFLIVAFSNKSPIAGIIGAAPLALAILCNFAVMGFLGIKLNLGTALISSLAVGIGIDYTIHFIEFFKREYRLEKNDFLRRTFLGCGKAIIINALSVGAGFGVLAFSQFKIIAELGMLIALSMLITALVSLTVIPALLMVIKPKFIFDIDNKEYFHDNK
jgi:predicted RND superfamily exporter protein